MNIIKQRDTIEGRLKLSENLINYVNKIKKEIGNDSVCIKRKNKNKALINIKKNKSYFCVLKRLGSTEETSNESYFGEVYKLYFPVNTKINEIKITNMIACKIIPLSDIDYKNKKNILYDPWRELKILQDITNNILKKGILPNFSLYYNYFICKDGNVSDYSNINIINKMKIRNVLKKLKIKHDDMKDIIEKYDTKNRTNQNIINSINLKLNLLENELKKYKEDMIKNPNPKYSLLVLIELEDTTLSKLINPSFKNSYTKIFLSDEYYLAKKHKNNFYVSEIINKRPPHIRNIKDKSKIFAWIYTNRLLIYSLLFQIVLGINALKHIGIVHLDLHVDNILIAFNDNPLVKRDIKSLNYWKYKINGEDYFIPNYGYQCKLSDFGLSETIESFSKRNKHEKREIAMFIIDKLSYFVFTSQEQHRVDNLSEYLEYNIIHKNIKMVFSYLQLFDFIIFIISFISELEYISKDMYFYYHEESIKEKRKENIGEMLDKYKVIPDYIDTLKMILANALNIFLNNLGNKNKNEKLKKYNYFEIINEIIIPFKKNNLKLNNDDNIINTKAFII
jgi:serine/threonine protein kinase